MESHKSYIVGLTGGIGSGKTAAANFFAEMGVRVIDADVIAHTLSHPPSPALAQVASCFGMDYLTSSGSLDRVKMRAYVFANPQARKQLEDIFHPLIKQECLRQIEIETVSPYIILVAPLLFENPIFSQMVHHSVVVDCSENQQIDRVSARSGLSRDEILTIIASQLSRERRIQMADNIISNDASLEQLHEQITQLHQTFLSLAQSMR